MSQTVYQSGQTVTVKVDNTELTEEVDAASVVAASALAEAAAATAQAGLAVNAVNFRETKTIRVGPSRDFKSQNTALAELASKRVGYVSNGIAFNLVCDADYYMSEQISVGNIDMTFVTITRDASGPIPVQRSAITQEPAFTDRRAGAKAVFSAFRGGTLPIINCLFAMDGSGTDADAANIVGFYVKDGFAYFGNGAGFTDVPWRGLYAFNSRIEGRYNDFRRCGNVLATIATGAAVRLSDTCSGLLRDSDLRGSAIGAYISQSTIMLDNSLVSDAVSHPTFPYSTGIGIFATGKSIVDADTVTATACAKSAIFLDGPVEFNATKFIGTGSGARGLDAQNGATIAGELANFSGSGTNAALDIDQRRNINLSSACSARGSGWVSNGAPGNALNVVSSVAYLPGLVASSTTQTPVTAYIGAQVNVSAATLTKPAGIGQHIACFTGATVDAYGTVDENGATALANVTPNFPSSAGLVRAAPPPDTMAADATLVVGAQTAENIVLDVPLTTGRQVQFASTLVNTVTYRLNRTANATGASLWTARATFPGNVGNYDITTLAAGQYALIRLRKKQDGTVGWADVEKGNL